MNSSNTGSAEAEPDRNKSTPERRTVPIPVLLAGVAALLFTVFIGIGVLPVLYAFLFPPVPPLPANFSLVTHSSPDYGQDDWRYTSPEDSCKVAQFFVEKGADCQLAYVCNPAAVPLTTVTLAERTTACSGQTQFSIFVMGWQAIITPTFAGGSELRLARRISWTGDKPVFAPG